MYRRCKCIISLSAVSMMLEERVASFKNVKDSSSAKDLLSRGTFLLTQMMLADYSVLFNCEKKSKYFH
jgi:hypothetical protein